MRKLLVSLMITASAATLGGTVVAQSASPADCAALAKVSRQKTYEADDRAILQCIRRGWDPPVSWRLNEGKSQSIRVGGAGGFSIGARGAPENPPSNGRSSVSAGIFNFSMSFPPWRGFPCQLPGGSDSCGGSSTPTPGGTGPGGTPGGTACAAAQDGTFGALQTVTAGNVGLTCGGAVPLAPVSLALNRSASGMLVADAGNRALTAYRQSGTELTPVTVGPVPTYLCNSQGERTVELTAPVGQIATFASGGNIALKLQRADPTETLDPFHPDPQAEPDHYLLIPIRNGVPAVPADCASDNDHYKTAAAITAALTIEPITGAPSTCDAVTLYPSGASCTGTMQFVALDKPNMVYPPSSSAGFSAIGGSSAFMASAAAASRIYAQNDTIMLFGAGGGSFVLPEGGVLKLNNGEQLAMRGPATINTSGRSVTLTNGGSVLGADGAAHQTVSAGSSFSPQADLPYVVRVTRNVELPAGMMAPTAGPAYIRLPLAAK